MDGWCAILSLIDSTHFELLELGKYKIGTHRGSFMSENHQDENDEKKK